MASEPDIAQLSDPGRSYPINCDRCVAIGREGLHERADAFLMVADGMGANRRGDTASRITAGIVPEVFLHELDASETHTRDTLAAALRKAVQEANDAVWKSGQEAPELKGMGSTCVAAVVAGDAAIVCHAGDSRAYLLSKGELLQLTADHSLIQEVVSSEDATLDLDARFGPVITRGIGLSRSLDADLVVSKIGPEDALLLCTDGLTNMVPEKRIASVLARAEDAASACQSLVAAANEAGGLDNIGVVVYRGSAFEPYELAEGSETTAAAATSSKRHSSRRHHRRGSSGLTVLAAVLAMAVIILGSVLYWEESERRRLQAENAKLRHQLIGFMERGSR